MGLLRWCHAGAFALDSATGNTHAHRCARPHRAPDGRALCRKRREGFPLVPTTPGRRELRSHPTTSAATGPARLARPVRCGEIKRTTSSERTT
jgi:hypothetical protein